MLRLDRRVMAEARSDALVVFGVNGDLAHKMIFPALNAMAKRDDLSVPIIGVALPDWNRELLREPVMDSIVHAGGIDDAIAFEQLLSRMTYVSADYAEPKTFTAIKHAPPALFATVIKALGTADLPQNARVIVEKPFGNTLTSAEELSRVARSAFAEDSIFRIDHFPGKEAITNILYVRFANSFLEPIWNRNYVASVQITVAEEFGIGRRGGWYATAGCPRDVIENHIFQIVVLPGMEPPSSRNVGAVHAEQAKVFKAARPLVPEDVVRGQYAGLP